MDLAHAGDGRDPAAADPAEERRADGELALPRAVEGAVDHGADPGPVEIDAVGDPGHQADVGAGRPLGDLADHQAPVGPLEPLQVGHAVFQAERRDRAAGELAGAVVLGPQLPR